MWQPGTHEDEVIHDKFQKNFVLSKTNPCIIHDICQIFYTSTALLRLWQILRVWPESGIESGSGSGSGHPKGTQASSSYIRFQKVIRGPCILYRLYIIQGPKQKPIIRGAGHHQAVSGSNTRETSHIGAGFTEKWNLRHFCGNRHNLASKTCCQWKFHVKGSYHELLSLSLERICTGPVFTLIENIDGSCGKILTKSVGDNICSP